MSGDGAETASDGHFPPHLSYKWAARGGELVNSKTAESGKFTAFAATAIIPCPGQP